ncbi:MAG: hypothetical protein PVI77_24290, partial [Desulfobacterales bacterium]
MGFTPDKQVSRLTGQVGQAFNWAGRHTRVEWFSTQLNALLELNWVELSRIIFKIPRGRHRHNFFSGRLWPEKTYN